MKYIQIGMICCLFGILFTSLRQQDKPSISQPTVLQASPMLSADAAPVTAAPNQKEPVYAVVVTAWNENNSYSWEVYFYHASTPEAAQKAAIGEYMITHRNCRSPMATVRVCPE
jgi:hypothetical protein